MITSKQIKEKYKIDNETLEKIQNHRKNISEIINKNNDKLLVVVGPCSIHNTDEALEYAKKLNEIKNNFPNLYIVMRTYFEKPRTTIGWKGLINDPNLNGSFDIESGLEKARSLLLKINKLGIPCGTEFLDNLTLNDISDLISWGAIGARTTESQIHREFGSNLDIPVGFKNSTSGDIQVAKDAILSSNMSHNFIGLDENSNRTIINSAGNPNSHIILRGGKNITNYDEKSIKNTSETLEKSNIKTGIIVDLSHANSLKDYKNQKSVAENIASQISAGEKNIVGVMIESNINEGNQKFDPLKDNKNNLKHGISITDSCVGIKETENILEMLNKAIKLRNK